MAKRARPETPTKQMSALELGQGIARLKRRIQRLEEFNPSNCTSRADPTIVGLEKSIEQALSDTFVHGTPDYLRYSAAATIDTASINAIYETPLHEVIDGLDQGKSKALALLRQAVEALEERQSDSQTQSVFRERSPLELTTGKIFLVHGHDHGTKETVARFLERIGMEPVILHEQADEGRTIIEKFEAHSDVSFAVVILTPDDTMSDGTFRARQNVVLELGYFIGKMTRSRVCTFKKGDIELPSDVLGVAWKDFDIGGAWKSELAKELQAAGFSIDWNKVMR